jgi:hypothetical protein
LDVGTRQNWSKLKAAWLVLYPRAQTIVLRASRFNEFERLRLNVNDLKEQRRDGAGGFTWGAITFAHALLEAGKDLPGMDDGVKGYLAYERLPPIVQGALPKYDMMIEPGLERLCEDLTVMDHRLLAYRVNDRADLESQIAVLGSQLAQVVDVLKSKTSGPLPGRVVGGNGVVRGIRQAAPQLGPQRAPATLSFEATPDGRHRYLEAVRAWEGTHGKNTVPSGSIPYPLTPGSPSPGSGECWVCGSKSHQRGAAECNPREALPEKEQQYRAAVGATVLHAMRVGATSAAQTALLHIQTGRWGEFEKGVEGVGGVVGVDQMGFISEGEGTGESGGGFGSSMGQGNGMGDGN